MRNSTQVAYEGLMTAFSVALIWLASAIPLLSWSGCVCAGIIPAVTISKVGLKSGIIVYFASSLLSLILVPSKKYVAIYIVFLGLYSIVKYKIEQLKNIILEWLFKIIYIILICVCIYFAFKFGFLIIGGKIPNQIIFVVLILSFVAFIFYDIFLSKIIALFRIFFRY